MIGIVCCISWLIYVFYTGTAYGILIPTFGALILDIIYFVKWSKSGKIIQLNSHKNCFNINELICPTCKGHSLVLNGTHVDGWYLVCNKVNCDFELEGDPHEDTANGVLNDLIEILNK